MNNHGNANTKTSRWIIFVLFLLPLIIYIDGFLHTASFCTYTDTHVYILNNQASMILLIAAPRSLFTSLPPSNISAYYTCKEKSNDFLIGGETVFSLWKFEYDIIYKGTANQGTLLSVHQFWLLIPSVLFIIGYYLHGIKY